MNTIYVGYDNKLTHKLWYTPLSTGSGQRRPLNLNEATEIQVQFLEDSIIRKTYSSLTHAGVTVENAQNGLVSYQPLGTDFSDVFRPDLINRMRWVVKTQSYPDGLVYDTPIMNCRIVK